MGHGAVLALALALAPPTDGPAGSWRALFASPEPGAVEFWSIALDGQDRRVLARHGGFADDPSGWSPTPATPRFYVRDAAASADGRWWAYRLDASPAKRDALWLANVDTRQLRLVAANVEQFQWSSQGARLLYALAPPPPSPMQEMHVVLEGRAWRLHDAQYGNDGLIAGPQRDFVYAGPWADPRRLLFWRAGVAFNQVVAFDVHRDAVRQGRTLLRTNVLQFGPLGATAGWALVTTDLEHRCTRAYAVDHDGRFGRPLMHGRSYVCANRGACVAFRDELTLVVARSEGPTGRYEWWWQEHPASLVTRDVRTGRETRLLEGRPGLQWTLVGSRPGEVMLVRRCLSASAWAWFVARDRECELQARTFDGHLLGTLHRGDDPPAFVGFVR